MWNLEQHMIENSEDNKISKERDSTHFINHKFTKNTVMGVIAKVINHIKSINMLLGLGY